MNGPAEYHDPRLVALYDQQHGGQNEDRFFLALASRAAQARVLDLRCGTGRPGPSGPPCHGD